MDESIIASGEFHYVGKFKQQPYAICYGCGKYVHDKVVYGFMTPEDPVFVYYCGLCFWVFFVNREAAK